jgi:hypothetical protein
MRTKFTTLGAITMGQKFSLFKKQTTCLKTHKVAAVADSVNLRVGWTGFDSRQVQVIYLYLTVSRLALGLTQPFVKWVDGTKAARV